MFAARERDRWNSIARVAAMIRLAVVLQWMTWRIEGDIEDEGLRLLPRPIMSISVSPMIESRLTVRR